MEPTLPTASNRDWSRFPDDENGELLWAIAQRGDALRSTREVMFTIDFPTITSLATFMPLLDDDFPERLVDRMVEQTLDVTLLLVPEHETLTSIEEELEALAEAFGGEMMGWSFVPVL